MREAGDSLEHIGKVLGVGASSVSRALARAVLVDAKTIAATYSSGA